jgi:hypothetical protein
MIFVLSIYDIIKSVRKGIKINDRLVRADKGAPHASDETTKEYQVINHRDKVAKNMVFKINP